MISKALAALAADSAWRAASSARDVDATRTTIPREIQRMVAAMVFLPIFKAVGYFSK
jgi:hypothetical protein